MWDHCRLHLWGAVRQSKSLRLLRFFNIHIMRWIQLWNKYASAFEVFQCINAKNILVYHHFLLGFAFFIAPIGLLLTLLLVDNCTQLSACYCCMKCPLLKRELPVGRPDGWVARRRPTGKYIPWAVKVCFDSLLAGLFATSSKLDCYFILWHNPVLWLLKSRY